MKKILSLLTMLCFASFIKANNIATSNISLTGQNTATNFTLIGFDISWENSWRTSTNESNYDGAWIFVKFRKNNTSLWQHATINYASTGTAAACGHTQAGGSTIQTPTDGKGVWMYRNADGFGTVNWTDNKLRWNYGVDGVLDNDSVEVRVFAVEMVYIPQGAFYLGSGGSETNRFRNGATDTYLNITSEAAITVGLAANNIFGYGNNNMLSGSIPATYPKGYNAFWIMKHEISQQGYVDFLNTLDFSASSARNTGAFGGSHPNLTSNFPERAAESLSSDDILSWLDWSALRPFTEFEYEKACRGANITPLANEYAWGNTTIVGTTGVQNDGTASEFFTNGNCNHAYVVNRAMRCGAQANLTSNRTQSGGTYYGVLEMSGNVYERAIAAGYADGRAFTGVHGDGNLNTTYTHNATNWPAPTTGSGLAYRGGAYTSAAGGSLVLSERDAAATIDNSRGVGYGGRGARTAQ